MQILLGTMDYTCAPSPIGYRVIAGEQRRHRINKTLEIDPFLPLACVSWELRSCAIGNPL
jgi:hypothetical protein